MIRLDLTPAEAELLRGLLENTPLQGTMRAVRQTVDLMEALLEKLEQALSASRVAEDNDQAAGVDHG